MQISPCGSNDLQVVNAQRDILLQPPSFGALPISQSEIPLASRFCCTRIFAALGSDGGEIFGPNEKAHGDDGDHQPHYNPAVAGNPDGLFVIAWDDFRRGDSDIWLSGYDDADEWSPDFAPEVASGAGEQSHPAVTLDSRGDLHLLWLERDDVERKIEWLLEGFPSQTARHWFTAETFRGLMRLRGVECAAPEGWAEAFHCRKAVL